jgi:hypothetical protein
LAYIVAPRKITHYLLSGASPTAAGKAAFFRNAGFRMADWPALAAALTAHPTTAALERIEPDAGYGRKYVYLCGMPAAPNGRRYCVRSVWMSRGSDFFFVTAYPQTTPPG